MNVSVAKTALQKNQDAGGRMLSAAEKQAGQGFKIPTASAKIPQFPLCAAPRPSLDNCGKLIQTLTVPRDPQSLGALGAQG